MKEIKTFSACKWDDMTSATLEQLERVAIIKKRVKGFDAFLVKCAPHYGFTWFAFENGEGITESRCIYIESSIHYKLNSYGGSNYRMIRAMLEKVEKTLFTDEELNAPIKDYDEYRRKDYFVRNYLPRRWKYESAFHIIRSEQEEQEREERIRRHFPYYSQVAFAYFPLSGCVDYLKKRAEIVEKRYQEFMSNAEQRESAILYELFNYECFYSWDLDGVIDHFRGTGITAAEIQKVFNRHKWNQGEFAQ